MRSKYLKTKVKNLLMTLSAFEDFTHRLHGQPICYIKATQKSTYLQSVWDFLMFCLIFLLSQVKRWAMMTYKYGICDLSHELTNDLKVH